MVPRICCNTGLLSVRPVDEKPDTDVEERPLVRCQRLGSPKGPKRKRCRVMETGPGCNHCSTLAHHATTRLYRSMVLFSSTALSGWPEGCKLEFLFSDSLENRKTGSAANTPVLTKPLNRKGSYGQYYTIPPKSTRKLRRNDGD